MAAQPEAGAQAAAAADPPPTLITGSVLGPDGAPVEGAVVVTSAGGQAVTDELGAFSLGLALPAGVAGLRVTAVAGSGATSLVGRVPVRSPARGGTTDAGALVLAQSADCEPSWLPTFGQAPGVSDGGVTPGISALAVFDDGDGPALYAAGAFISAGGVTVNRVARWDGALWSALGSGMSSEVYALAVFDDGTGEALYAGGAFGTAGGVPAGRIARWNGSSWSAVGSGMNQVVYALAVFDDGDGPGLYAAGDFTTAGGATANRIARWDGAGWSALDSGLNERVWTLAVFEDAHGPVLVAAGIFTSAGHAPANRIAKWDGTSWTVLGTGTDNAVRTLVVFDDGGGPALYAGGHFLSAGGVAASRIATWDGLSWSALGGGMNDAVYGLGVFDDGTGPALYAGGRFTVVDGEPASRVARWDGSGWSALGSGTDGDVRALAGFDAGNGPALFVGGDFSIAGGLVLNNVASWTGASWEPLGQGMNGGVSALAVFDDGGGPALYAGGGFTTQGGLPANRIAKWDGTSWSPLDGGLGGSSQTVDALVVFDDGGGPALYAAGGFYWADDVAAKYVAKWDGTSWSDLDGGMELGLDPFVGALVVFDDGSGPALYAGGDFTVAGGVPASRIARWDGTSWSALGSGMNAPTGSPDVRALAVFDDGGGPALYAGGDYLTAGGVTANGIAKWDGTSWSALGVGMPGFFESVLALAVFDDGSGPALYAGGHFQSAGGVPANHIAKWDGSGWSALGSGVAGVATASTPYVSCLQVFDDGNGPRLYAGGDFTTIGGVPANRIAKWDGSSWSALDSGVSESVWALTVFDAGDGPALFAGGQFGVAFDSGDGYLARWGGCAGFPDPWTDLGGALPGLFFDPILVGTGDLGPGTSGSLLLSNAVGNRPAMLFVSAASTPVPFKCGTLVPMPSLLQLPLMTDGFGAISLSWSSWPGGLSGLSLYFQYAIKDPAAICGTSLSNALRGDVP